MFPFHGQSNQRFNVVGKKIVAVQNGQVVTYVGGADSFVLQKPSAKLKTGQSFMICYK
jgi:hypothetical protein